MSRGGRRRPRLPTEPVAASVDALSSDGRGICRVDGKVVFVHGAIPGENIEFVYTAKRRDHDEGRLTRIEQASSDRVQPPCDHFDVCGGCALQHLSASAQVGIKQRQLRDALQRIGKVSPEVEFEPLSGPAPLGYRRKARLGVRYVRKKARVLVGFRERGNNFLADIERCVVLHPRVGELITPLAELIAGLTLREQIPQIEVAMDDRDLALVFRVMDTPDTEDLNRLTDFAASHDVHIYLQPGGPDTVAPLAAAVGLAYRLPAYDLRVAFEPGDFTQVNLDVNRLMVDRALELLAPDDKSQVLDLFCGIGNFTLPIARHAGDVLGVEGDSTLVARARANAASNGLHNVQFEAGNLYDQELLRQAPWLGGPYDRVLLDPPRSGAQEVIPLLGRLRPCRIVYVSCNPATLARDAAELVQGHGYHLAGAGIIDMFPHTNHVESIALFELNHGN